MTMKMNNLARVETQSPLKVHQFAASDFQDANGWDQFVRTSSDGTVFHLSTWKRVVEQVFKLTPHYLLACRGETICGVLPLFEVYGLLSGHVLISVLYGVYGGLCGE